MAKQPKRNIVSKSLRVCTVYDTIIPEELIRIREEKLANLLEQFHKSVSFEIDSYCEQWDPNTYHALYMKWQDFEDDKEFNARLTREQEQRENDEKRERREFERLSKKFSK